jgi:hypothetical protein
MRGHKKSISDWDEEIEDPDDWQATEDLCIWDIVGNPDRRLLQGQCGTVAFPPTTVADFCTVMTTVPILRGIHFFEFVVHRVSSELWCGVTSDKAQHGVRVCGQYLRAWTYHSGTKQGGLMVNRACELELARLSARDVVGMAVDAEGRALAFSLNGVLQGTCSLPPNRVPLYVLTHLATGGDCIELRAAPLHNAPREALEALQSARSLLRHCTINVASKAMVGAEEGAAQYYREDGGDTVASPVMDGSYWGHDVTPLATSEAAAPSVLPQATSPIANSAGRAVDEWCVDDVCGFLCQIGLGMYAERFRAECVDGSILAHDLTQEIAHKDLGMKSLHIGKLLREVHTLRGRPAGL